MPLLTSIEYLLVDLWLWPTIKNTLKESKTRTIVFNEIGSNDQARLNK